MGSELLHVNKGVPCEKKCVILRYILNFMIDGIEIILNGLYTAGIPGLVLALRLFLFCSLHVCFEFARLL